ncbi:YfhO family protein [Enterococcus crotali]|uniref:YfhO family protein n=1 Tax=Enterococcus crotali TaxID=1453587 RepID=UPI00046E6101|nr:YfhO family protein [Enterococcus crotali]
MRKQRIKEFLKQNSLAMLLSFSLPVVLMALIYYFKDIYPGSKLTVLASDSFTQYANFHASFNNVLHGKQNIFYTWSGSLGLNYWALMAYYLNGLFTPLVFFFDNGNMADALYYLTLLKFGASGLAFWVFAHNTFKINRWLVVGLSVSYALMSYSVGYSEVIMWLDTFMYLPLIILGIHRLMDDKKPALLFISYLLLFLSNFYMAFMVGVFSFLYFFARAISQWTVYKKSILPYLITSLLAGGASMITILPTIFDLSNNGESLSAITTFLTPDTGPWDFVAKSLVGVYDTSKFESMPFIYIGLFALIFCMFYFISNKIALKNKLLFGSLFILLIASVYILPLNLAWHGLHSPNMLLFRFSFLFSFLVILLAGYGLEVFEKSDFNRLLNGVLGITGLIIVFLIVSNKKRYGVITTMSLVVTIGLLAAYVLLLYFYVYQPKWKKWLPVLILLLMSGEAFVNAQALVKGIKQDWNYPSRELIAKPYPHIKALSDQAFEENDTFFRMENLNPISLDDSFNFGYHGIGMFSSIRNRHSSQYMNALGFRSLGSNLQVHYENNTLLMDALIGMKYIIAKGNLNKFGYEKMAQSGDYSLYKNAYALPLGIMTDKGIYEKEAVRNQTELFNYLSGSEGELFSFGEATMVDSKNVIVTEEENTVSFGEEEPNKIKSVTWLITVPEHSQGYLSLVPTDLGAAIDTKVHVTVDGVTRRTDLRDDGQYHSIGYYDKTKTIKVTTSFTGGKQRTTLFKPDVVFLNTQEFEKSVKKIQEKSVDFKTNGRKAQARTSFEEDQVLLTTIPYDKGWKAYIDGKQVKIPTFKDAFLAIPVPAGTHEIKFVFLPQGFVIGAILFILCILLFIGYSYWLKKQLKVKSET